MAALCSTIYFARYKTISLESSLDPSIPLYMKNNSSPVVIAKESGTIHLLNMNNNSSPAVIAKESGTTHLLDMSTETNIY